jgi:sulfur carrier protein ThiS
MLEAVGIPPAVVAAVVRDDELVPKDYRPRDGERIKAIAVVGGG